MIDRSSNRAALERLLRFYDEGHVNLLVVTIIESHRRSRRSLLKSSASLPRIAPK
jgi:hypothetical protein